MTRKQANRERTTCVSDDAGQRRKVDSGRKQSSGKRVVVVKKEGLLGDSFAPEATRESAAAFNGGQIVVSRLGLTGVGERASGQSVKAECKWRVCYLQDYSHSKCLISLQAAIYGALTFSCRGSSRGKLGQQVSHSPIRDSARGS